jgi:hypothetical protein
MSNRPFSIIVGSSVPRVPFVRPLPLANAVQTRVFSSSVLSMLYSSFQSPPLTEPVTAVGSVTLASSAGAVICTVGGATLSLTRMLMSSNAVSAPSLAVRRKT